MEYLQRIEQEVQERWEKQKVYENNAPAQPKKSPDEKFLVTFPYPYMNGRLHLGHTFSLSKAEVRSKEYFARNFKINKSPLIETVRCPLQSSQGKARPLPVRFPLHRHAYKSVRR